MRFKAEILFYLRGSDVSTVEVLFDLRGPRALFDLREPNVLI